MKKLKLRHIVYGAVGIFLIAMGLRFFIMARCVWWVLTLGD